jgi:hypothetical protein
MKTEPFRASWQQAPISEATLSGMHRLGPAKPVAKAVLDSAQKALGLVYPSSYRQLLETWGPGSLCGAFRVHCPDETLRREWAAVAADRRERRKDSPRSWAAVDDATLARLSEWADTDASSLLWDTGHRGPDGEYPIYLLDREGDVARLVARSLPELAAAFVSGGLDRVFPPARRGAWDAPNTWGTERPTALASTLLPALQSADDAAARAALNTYAAAVTGWEAASVLVDLLRDARAEALEPKLRLSWLERAHAWRERCAPGLSKEDGLEALLEELRSGRAVGLPFPADTHVDPACAQLTLHLERARLGKSALDCTVRNTSTSPSVKCVLRSEMLNDRSLIEELAIAPLAPGETFTYGLAWPESAALHVRVSINPRSLGAPYGSYLRGDAF